MTTRQQREDTERLLRTAIELGMTEEHAADYRCLVRDEEMSLLVAINRITTTICDLKKVKNANSHLANLNSDGEPSSGDIRVYNTTSKNDEKEILISTDIVVCQSQWISTDHISIPVKDASGRYLPSVLGAMYENSGRNFTYTSEYDVRRYCLAMIQDAVSGLRLSDVDIQHEVSLYMMRPDIVIVLSRGGRRFFAAVVKAPTERGNDELIYGNKYLGGQIWSYLYSMKAAGLDNPIGAIMTFNTIAIVSLKDCSDNKEHITHLEQIKAKLSTGITPTHDIESKKKLCNKSIESADTNSCELGKLNPFEEVEMEKMVYYSDVHHEGHVFPFLLQAIMLAYQTTDANVQDKPTVLKNGDKIGGQLAFKMGPSFHDWVALPLQKQNKNIEIPSNMCAMIQSKYLPDEITSYYYVLGKLREGETSSTYLACSEGGHVCVIKDYHMIPSAKPTNAERFVEEDAYRETLSELAQEEMQQWECLYKDRFDVRVQNLGGKAYLLLPYGYEITGHTDNRWKHIPAIRNQLVQFTTGPEISYVYKNSSLHWRHVLLDTEGDIFICDLESLEETQVDKEEMVYKQLQVLLKPMINDKKVEETRQWVQDRSNLDNLFSLITTTETLEEFFTGHYASIQQGDCASLVAELNSTENAKSLVAFYMIDYYLTTSKTVSR